MDFLKGQSSVIFLSYSDTVRSTKENHSKMKFLAVFVIACIALAAAQGPTKISSNNVGDIINVDVDATAKISNTVDATIINVLLRYLNSQRIQVGGGGGGDNGPSWPGLPDLPEFPGLKLKKLLF